MVLANFIVSIFFSFLPIYGLACKFTFADELQYSFKNVEQDIIERTLQLRDTKLRIASLAKQKTSSARKALKTQEVLENVLETYLSIYQRQWGVEYVVEVQEFRPLVLPENQEIPTEIPALFVYDLLMKTKKFHTLPENRKDAYLAKQKEALQGIEDKYQFSFDLETSEFRPRSKQTVSKPKAIANRPNYDGNRGNIDFSLHLNSTTPTLTESLQVFLRYVNDSRTKIEENLRFFSIQMQSLSVTLRYFEGEKPTAAMAELGKAMDFKFSKVRDHHRMRYTFLFSITYLFKLLGHQPSKEFMFFWQNAFYKHLEELDPKDLSMVLYLLAVNKSKLTFAFYSRLNEIMSERMKVFDQVALNRTIRSFILLEINPQPVLREALVQKITELLPELSSRNMKFIDSLYERWKEKK